MQEEVVARARTAAVGNRSRWLHGRAGDDARPSLLDLLDRLNPSIAELTQAIEREVENYPAAQRLRTHPGVGVLTSLAFAPYSATRSAFAAANRWRVICGLVPLEDSSGNRRRLGHITKQGSSIVRFLLVEAAQVTVRSRAGVAQQIFSSGAAARTEDSRKSPWLADWLCNCSG